MGSHQDDNISQSSFDEVEKTNSSSDSLESSEPTTPDIPPAKEFIRLRRLSGKKLIRKKLSQSSFNEVDKTNSSSDSLESSEPTTLNAPPTKELIRPGRLSAKKVIRKKHPSSANKGNSTKPKRKSINDHHDQHLKSLVTVPSDKEKEPKALKESNKNQETRAFVDIVKEVTSSRRRKPVKLDDAVVEAECSEFLDKMMDAYENDRRARSEGKPAFYKLMLNEEVRKMYRKKQHSIVLLRAEYLPILRIWLGPQPPENELPNIDTRLTILHILSEMPTPDDFADRLLTSNGLGMIVNYLSKRDPVQAHRRLAEKLVEKWSRHIFHLSDNFRQLLSYHGWDEEGSKPMMDLREKYRLANENQLKLEKLEDKHLKFAESHKVKHEENPNMTRADIPKPGNRLQSSLPSNQVNTEHKKKKKYTKEEERIVRRVQEVAKINKTGVFVKPSAKGPF